MATSPNTRRADERHSQRCVEVLTEFLRMEVDSITLPSARAKRLVQDVDAIPQRYAATLAADRRFWQRRRKKKR